MIGNGIAELCLTALFPLFTNLFLNDDTHYDNYDAGSVRASLIRPSGSCHDELNLEVVEA